MRIAQSPARREGWPGESMAGEHVELRVREATADEMKPYERLLGDALRGDSMLFVREDSVEAAWKVVDPVLNNATLVHEYEPNTWGPAEADSIIANGKWRNPKPTAEKSGWIDKIIVTSWTPAERWLEKRVLKHIAEETSKSGRTSLELSAMIAGRWLSRMEDSLTCGFSQSIKIADTGDHYLGPATLVPLGQRVITAPLRTAGD